MAVNETKLNLSELPFAQINHSKKEKHHGWDQIKHGNGTLLSVDLTPCSFSASKGCVSGCVHVFSLCLRTDCLVLIEKKKKEEEQKGKRKRDEYSCLF